MSLSAGHCINNYSIQRTSPTWALDVVCSDEIAVRYVDEMRLLNWKTCSASYPDRRHNSLRAPLDVPCSLSGSTQGLPDKDLSTTDPDENQQVSSPRHVRQLDKVLHIRSLGSNTESFRSLRAVLLQLRDSLQAGNISPAESKVTQESAGASGTHMDVPRTASRRLDGRKDGVGTVLAYHPMNVHDQSTFDNKKRPDRISLPSFYFGDYNRNGESARSGDTDLRWRLTSSWRHRTNVKFADEFGLNLNTFVMIPSRVQKTGSPPTMRSGVSVDRSPTTYGGNASKSFSPSKYIELSGDDSRHVVKPSMVDSGTNGMTSLCLEPSNKVKVNAAADGAASVRSPTHSALICIEEDSKEDMIEPHFRLCFDQPFADQERFHARLSSQKVCLENVRVENWSLGGSSSPSSQPPQAPFPTIAAANSVMLCSIRVNNLHPEKHVFARCTDNDWVTFTDLPAQHVGKIDSLGYAHDMFCFAVRRPLYTANFQQKTDADPPQVAVEFAVCYKVAGETYWDNNDGANYRIEWF